MLILAVACLLLFEDLTVMMGAYPLHMYLYLPPHLLLNGLANLNETLHT